MQAPNRPPVDPATLYILDFEVVKEGWSSYSLADGNRIRARVTILSIRGQRIPPQKGDLIAPETNIVVKVDCPPNRRGPKGSAATPEEISDPKGHGGDELEVMNANEPWNEYRITGTSIRLRERLILDRVFRIKDRFDNLGDPVYVVRFTVVPTIEG